MASYRKRENGLWEYRISYKDAQGKYRRKEKGGFKTKKEAQKAASEVEVSGVIKETDDTLADYFKKWYTVFKKPHLTQTTIDKYNYSHTKIAAYFKDTKISSITSISYQKFFNTLAEKYSQQTIKMINTHIKQCVKQALVDDAIKKDFTQTVVVKSQKEASDQREFYLEVEEYEELLTNCNLDYQSHFFIYLIAKTGLRFSEAQGLTIDDVDEEHKLLHVHRTYKVFGKDKGWHQTKNKQSIRDVPVSSDVIKQIKERYVENPDKRLFTSVSNTAANKALKKLVNRPFHIHGLRHSYISYLLSKSIDIMTVSKIVGHKDITTTLSIYSHLLEDRKQSEFQKIRDLFGADLGYKK